MGPQGSFAKYGFIRSRRTSLDSFASAALELTVLIQRRDRQKPHDRLLAAVARIHEEGEPSVRIHDCEALDRKRFGEPADFPWRVLIEHIVQPVQVAAGIVKEVSNGARKYRDRLRAALQMDADPSLIAGGSRRRHGGSRGDLLSADGKNGLRRITLRRPLRRKGPVGPRPTSVAASRPPVSSMKGRVMSRGGVRVFDVRIVVGGVGR